MFIVPEKVKRDGVETGVLFGDVGTYKCSTNTIDITASDGCINWVDLNFIDDYYQRIKNGESTTPAEDDAIDRAGFNMSVEYPEGETPDPNYFTYLDIAYAVHTVTNPKTASWADLATNGITDFEYMMKQLMIRMSDYKTYNAQGYGGDATLDGKVTQLDVNYLEDIAEEYPEDEYLYIFRKEWGDNGNGRTIFQNLYRTFQIQTNCHLISSYASGGNVSPDDIQAVQIMAEDIYSTVTYPVDSAVWIGSAVDFTVEIKKIPSSPTNKYYYKLTQNGTNYPPDEPSSYKEAITEPSTNITTITFTKNSVTLADNKSVIGISVYEPLTTISTDEDYEDATKCNKYTYYANLYVADEQDDILWGDTDNNHIVNIIDAYKILNDYLYKRGDVNRDDMVDSRDASQILKYYSLISTGKTAEQAVAELSCTLADMERGDVNFDGKTSASDASFIVAIYSARITHPDWDDEQVETWVQETYGIPFHFYPTDTVPRTLGELNALLTVNGVRTTTYNKETGEKILASIKDKNIHLS